MSEDEQINGYWSEETIRSESDWQLHIRLKKMAMTGETYGRQVALRRAADRLLMLSQIVGATWRDNK